MVTQSDSQLYKIIDSFTTMEQIVKAADNPPSGTWLPPKCRGLGDSNVASSGTCYPGDGSTPLNLVQHQGWLSSVIIRQLNYSATNFKHFYGNYIGDAAPHTNLVE